MVQGNYSVPDRVFPRFSMFLLYALCDLVTHGVVSHHVDSPTRVTSTDLPVLSLSRPNSYPSMTVTHADSLSPEI